MKCRSNFKIEKKEERSKFHLGKQFDRNFSNISRLIFDILFGNMKFFTKVCWRKFKDH